MTPIISHSRKGKAMETVEGSVVVRGRAEGAMNRKTTEDFEGSGATLYDTIMMDTHHYTFVESRRVYTKSES